MWCTCTGSNHLATFLELDSDSLQHILNSIATVVKLLITGLRREHLGFGLTTRFSEDPANAVNQRDRQSLLYESAWPAPVFVARGAMAPVSPKVQRALLMVQAL